MSADWDASPSWSCTGPVGVRTRTLKSSVPHHEEDEHNNVPPFLRPPQRGSGKGVAKRLKARKWKTAFDSEGRPVGFHRLLKSIALGGVDHSIRAEVWEFLLGCYGLGTTAEYRQGLRAARRERYRKLVEQCHEMHDSIGTGNMAYTVGSKVMDARLSKDYTGSGAVKEEGEVGTPSDPHPQLEEQDEQDEQEEEEEDQEGEDDEEDDEEDEEAVERAVVVPTTAPPDGISACKKPVNSDEDDDSPPPSVAAGFDSVYRKCSSEGPENELQGVAQESETDSKLEGCSSSTRNVSEEGDPDLEKRLDNNPSASSSQDRSISVACVDYSNGFTDTLVGKFREKANHGKPKKKKSSPLEVGPFRWSTGSMKRINSWLLRDRRKKDRGIKVGDSTSGFAVGAESQEEVPGGSGGRVGGSKVGVGVDMECDSLHEPVAALGRSASGERIAEWLWMLHRIAVDVVRTDQHLEFYGDTKNMARMSDILAVYAWIDPKTGYCQGMSDLLSPFIIIFEDDADAFWCFESLFKRVRQNFQMEGPVGVMKQLDALSRILEVSDPQMAKHLAIVGADNFLFAFRMLLVLFRREVSFGESLCMWEMMWAADFNQAMALSVEFNCLEALVLRISPPSGFLSESGRSEEFNSVSGPLTMSFASHYGSPPHEYSGEIPHSGAFGVNFLGRGPLCGLRPAGLLMKNHRHRMPLVSTLLERNGDEELSVFCVAAILVHNRNKLLRDIQSMDDAIKTFNEMKLIIQVHSSVHAAMKLRKKYQNQLAKQHASSPDKQQQHQLQQQRRLKANSL